MKINIFCKIFILTIFLELTVFLGSFVLVDNEDTISANSGKHLVETDSNESSIKETTDFHENDIVQEAIFRIILLILRITGTILKLL